MASTSLNISGVSVRASATSTPRMYSTPSTRFLRTGTWRTSPRTGCPTLTNSAHKCRPTNPEAPVTSTVIGAFPAF